MIHSVHVVSAEEPSIFTDTDVKFKLTYICYIGNVVWCQI